MDLELGFALHGLNAPGADGADARSLVSTLEDLARKGARKGIVTGGVEVLKGYDRDLLVEDPPPTPRVDKLKLNEAWKRIVNPSNDLGAYGDQFLSLRLTA